MSRFSVAFFLLVSFVVFSQDKTYHFNNKISYKAKIPVELEEEYEDYPIDGYIEIAHYLSNGELLKIIEGDYNYFNREGFFINKNKQYFDVYVNSLDHIASMTDSGSGVGNMPYRNEYLENFISVRNLKSKKKINGYTCSEYLIKSKQVSNIDEKKSKGEIKICVDEKSPLNNVEFMFPQTKLKGLLVRFDGEKLNDFTLVNVIDANVKVMFDENKALQKARKISLEKEQYKN